MTLGLQIADETLFDVTRGSASTRLARHQACDSELRVKKHSTEKKMENYNVFHPRMMYHTPGC